MTRTLRPDVVLLDVRLPDGNGIELARTMRAWTPPPAVVLTSTADYSHVVRDCGANGFLPKGSFSGPMFREVIDTA